MKKIDKRVLPVDDTVFNKIDSKEKAFCLGILKRRAILDRNPNYIYVSINDYDVINRIKCLLKTDYKIMINFHKKHNNVYCLRFFDENGKIYNKIQRDSFPKIKRKYYFDFIKGFLCNTGCFYKYKNCMSACLAFSARYFPKTISKINDIFNEHKINSIIYNKKK